MPPMKQIADGYAKSCDIPRARTANPTFPRIPCLQTLVRGLDQIQIHDPFITVRMKIEPISDDTIKVINIMRDCIAKGLTEQSNKTIDGWRYVGEKFLEIVESLHQAMQQELEAKKCNVR